MKTWRRKRDESKVIGTQTKEPGAAYEPSPYVISEGLVFYNLLTGEIVEVEDPAIDETDELIRRWFLVPAGITPAGLATLIRQQLMANRKVRSQNSYTIFTTTGCNAGCAYCWEQGVEVQRMDEQTAQDTASFILAHANSGRDVNLRWFGGEPLKNPDAITTICSQMQAFRRPYISTMSSNGDLLPEIPDETLKAWHLRQVQLTVDAIGKDYDAIKGLPAGAYERLLATVRRLSDLGIRSTIRVHYTPTVGLETAKRIVDDFKDLGLVGMYARLLYDDDPAPAEYYDALYELEDYMIAANVYTPTLLGESIGPQCMADNRGVYCITPKGDLTTCEHFVTGATYGSIYGGDIDQTILDTWASKRKTAKASCTDCPMYPVCEILTECPAEDECTTARLSYMIKAARRELRLIAGKGAANG